MLIYIVIVLYTGVHECVRTYTTHKQTDRQTDRQTETVKERKRLEI